MYMGVAMDALVCSYIYICIINACVYVSPKVLKKLNYNYRMIELYLSQEYTQQALYPVTKALLSTIHCFSIYKSKEIESFEILINR